MLKKYLLMLPLFMTLLLLSSPANISAQTPDGSSQEDALPIESANEGNLLQFEEHWYTFTVPNDAYRGIETLNLYMFYENGQLIDSSDKTRYPYTDLYLYADGTDQVGSGKDWTGQIEGGKQYWVKVINESDYVVDYVLAYETDFIPPAPEPEPTPEPEIAQESEVEITPEEPTTDNPVEDPNAVPFLTDTGATPNEATEFSLTDLTRGKVESESTGWRSVSFADPGNTNARKHLTITCFATPFDGNTVRDVQFRLYQIENAEKWDYETLDNLEEFGAMEFNLRHNMSSAFGDGETPAQFIWDGWVTAGDEYVIGMLNGTDKEIDYWCFPHQMDNVELGKPSVRVLPNFEVGKAPSNPLPLQELNEAAVTTDQQLWYSFRVSDPGDGEQSEHVIINMSFTPNNGAQGYNDAYRVNFDIYNGNDVVYWSHTDLDNHNTQSFGTGSAVVRDNNADTGELTWDGWVVDGNLYYVQVRNGARYPIDAKIEVIPITAERLTVTTTSGIQ